MENRFNYLEQVGGIGGGFISGSVLGLAGLALSGYGLPLAVGGAIVGYGLGKKVTEIALGANLQSLDFKQKRQQLMAGAELAKLQVKEKSQKIDLNAIAEMNPSKSLVNKITGEVIVEARSERQDAAILAEDVESMEEYFYKGDIIDLIFDPVTKVCRHFWVSGATGSGKSTAVNAILSNLKDRLGSRGNLIIADPKYLGEENTDWVITPTVCGKPETVDLVKRYSAHIESVINDCRLGKKRVRNLPVQFVFCDEYNVTFTQFKDELSLPTSEIYQQGRAIRSSFGLATQSHLVSQTGITTVDRDNFVIFFMGSNIKNFLESERKSPKRDALLEINDQMAKDGIKYRALIVYENGMKMTKLPDWSEYAVTSDTTEFGDESDVERGFMEGYHSGKQPSYIQDEETIKQLSLDVGYEEYNHCIIDGLDDLTDNQKDAVRLWNQWVENGDVDPVQSDSDFHELIKKLTGSVYSQDGGKQRDYITRALAAADRKGKLKGTNLFNGHWKSGIEK